MSETWVDAEEYEDLGEGTDDSYGSGEEFGEESRSARQRRERQRQILDARRQAHLRRTGRPQFPASRPVRAAVRARPTITAVRSPDLETRAAQDSLRRALEESNRRASRATWAAVAGAAVDQGLASFEDDLKNLPYVAAGARFAPLLFLSPQKKRGGVEGVITDPRVVGGAAILGIALLGNFMNKPKDVSQIQIMSPSTIASGGTLSAMAYDRNGKPLTDANITWQSGSTDLQVSPTGTITGSSGAQGTVLVFAGGKSQSQQVTISGSSAPSDVAVLEITSPSTVATGDTLSAVAYDSNGDPLTGVNITWGSGSKALTVDPQKGTITGNSGAKGKVVAFAGGQHKSGRVTIQ
jgi:hypothetical protein